MKKFSKRTVEAPQGSITGLSVTWNQPVFEPCDIHAEISAGPLFSVESANGSTTSFKLLDINLQPIDDVEITAPFDSPNGKKAKITGKTWT